MTNNNYDDFTLSLALFDALPVIFFCIAVIIIAVHFQNPLFLIGSLLCTLAGIGKVTWKILLAGTKKNIVLLNRQLRVLMPTGFLLILIGVITGRSGIDVFAIINNILNSPALLCFCITLIGMVMMSVFAFTLDSTKSRSNWIEQITNAIAQGCFLLGVIFLTL